MVEPAYVDQGCTGQAAAKAPRKHGIRLEAVKHPMAKRGFVLLPRRWWSNAPSPGRPLPRLARNYEQLDTTLKGFHSLPFASLMLARMFHLLSATS